MPEKLIDYFVGTVQVTEETRARFKYLCAKENIYAKDKVAAMITDLVKDIKVKM